MAKVNYREKYEGIQATKELENTTLKSENEKLKAENSDLKARLRMVYLAAVSTKEE
jgi:hypothetical protein